MLLDNYNSAMHSCVSRYFYFVLTTNPLRRIPECPSQNKNRPCLHLHDVLIALRVFTTYLQRGLMSDEVRLITTYHGAFSSRTRQVGSE